MAKIVIGVRKEELGAWRENGREDRAQMQPQRREVRVENDEYEREQQQRLAKQIKCVVVLRNDHIFAFCAVQKRAHILELFQRFTYALPSFSHFLHFVAHALVSSPDPTL